MSKMDEQERAIWNAAYAAAFSAGFRESVASVGWDRAEETETAEVAIGVADLAVIRLRDWRRENDPVIGTDSGRTVRE